MVKRFHIAALNKSSVRAEAIKRFRDRNYSKCVLKNYEPDPSRAKFLRRDRGFSIYSIPVVKKKGRRKCR